MSARCLAGTKIEIFRETVMCSRASKEARVELTYIFESPPWLLNSVSCARLMCDYLILPRLYAIHPIG